MQDANPLECESTQGGLVGAAARAVAFVECLRPEGARDGLTDPLDEALSLEGGASGAPVDRSGVSAALGDGGDTDKLLQRGGVWEALAPLAKRGEQAWSECGAGARERAEEFVVRQFGTEGCDLGVEALDGGAGGAKQR